MVNSIVKNLVIATAIFAIAANAKPIEEEDEPNAGNPRGREGISPAPLTGRSIFDQYTMGQDVDDAKILSSYQYEQSFDGVQSEISLEYDYPSLDYYSNDEDIITKITLYVEAGDNAITQAYVTKGGIGQSSISLEVVAQNTNSLRYMVVIYGKSV